MGWDACCGYKWGKGATPGYAARRSHGASRGGANYPMLHEYWQEARKRGAAKEMSLVCDRMYVRQLVSLGGHHVKLKRVETQRPLLLILLYMREIRGPPLIMPLIHRNPTASTLYTRAGKVRERELGPILGPLLHHLDTPAPSFVSGRSGVCARVRPAVWVRVLCVRAAHCALHVVSPRDLWS